MIQVPEKFYTSFKAPYTLYTTHQPYVEVFIDPTFQELQEIESFPLTKFIMDKSGKVFFFNSDLLHRDAISKIKVEPLITGDMDFSNKQFYIYEQEKGANLLKKNSYIQKRFTAFEIRDYSLRSTSYGRV